MKTTTRKTPEQVRASGLASDGLVSPFLRRRYNKQARFDHAMKAVEWEIENNGTGGLDDEQVRELVVATAFESIGIPVPRLQAERPRCADERDRKNKMSKFKPCRGCVTPDRCAAKGRCLSTLSAQAPVEKRGASKLVGTGELVSWRKACACKSASATNRFITEHRTDPETHAVLVVTTFLPMPSCLECNKPWTMMEPANSRSRPARKENR